MTDALFSSDELPPAQGAGGAQTAPVVLARKWRPKKFAQVVGQDHVVKALSHALNAQRLHHAYLLTGTRGTGKTTVVEFIRYILSREGQRDVELEGDYLSLTPANAREQAEKLR